MLQQSDHIMKIVFATGNANKLREAQQILGGEFTLITPNELGITEEIPETSDTIKGNALEKAQYIWDRTKMNCFADDTGLEVDFLNGAPGVHSARYASQAKSEQANMEKLLEELKDVPNVDSEGKMGRSARFRCVVALIIDGIPTLFEGACEGEITHHPAGEGGFGYDPVFRPIGYQKNFSEITPEEKNSISHRGIAMRKLADYLHSL